LKTITFDPITAKQVRFVITSSYGDTEATHDSFASAAEVAFYPPEEGVDPEPEVNREALEAAIKAAEDKDQAEFTEESWSVLASALEDAKGLLADEDASQEDIDAGVEALEAAIAQLEEVEDGTDPDPEPEINREAAEAAMTEAEDEDEAEVTKASGAGLASEYDK